MTAKSVKECILAGLILLAVIWAAAPLDDLADYTRDPLLDPAGVLQVYPWVHYNMDQLGEGHFPLWNPYTAMGQPHLANIQTALLYPLYWPWYAAGGGEAGYGALMVFRVWLAGMFWFLFMRRKLASFTGAMVTALAYAAGGYSLWFMQLIDLNSQLLLPLCMMAFSSLVKRPRIPGLVASALLVALSIQGGHPEAAFITVLMGSLYAVSEYAVKRGVGAHALPGLFALLSAGVVGVLITLPSLLPFINYLSRCWTMHGPGFGFFHLDPRGLANLVVPGVHTMFADMPATIPVEHIGKSALEMFRLPYHETAVPGNLTGAGPLVCALALVGALGLRRKRWQAAFFAGLLFALLGVTAGLPGFRLIAFVPPFNFNSNFKFFFSEIHVCLAVLAGMGADFLIAETGKRLTGKGVKVVSSAIVLLLFAGLYMNSQHVRPFVRLSIPDSETIADIKLKMDDDEERVVIIDDFWPANRPSIHKIKDVRSSDAMFYSPYMDLLNEINGFSSEEGLGFFYPSYFTRPSPGRLLADEAEKLAASLIVGDRMWSPYEAVDRAIVKGHGVWGLAPPRGTTVSVSFENGVKAKVKGLFLHPPARLTLPDESERGNSGPIHFHPVVTGERGDGVQFLVIGQQGSGKTMLYSRHALPPDRNKGGHPGPTVVDAEGHVSLVTLPGAFGDYNSDWAVFAGLAREDEGTVFPEPETMLEGGVRIYKTGAPFWADLSGKEIPVERGAGDDFLVQMVGRSGTITIREAWYPGWRARLDGRETRISPSQDKVSWKIKAGGEREAFFRFVPADFRIGLYSGFTALLFSFIMLIVGARKKRAEQA